jgi:hypothetical protein
MKGYGASFKTYACHGEMIKLIKAEHKKLGVSSNETCG